MSRKKLMIFLNVFFLIVLFYFFRDQSKQASGHDFLRGCIFALIAFSVNLWMDWKLRKTFHPIWTFYVGNIFLLGSGAYYISNVLGTPEEWSLSVSGHLPLNHLFNGFLLLFGASICFIIGFYLSQKSLRKMAVVPSSPDYLFPKDILVWTAILMSWGLKILKPDLGVLGLAFSLLPFGGLYVFSCQFYLKSGFRKNVYAASVLAIVVVELIFASRSAMREGYLIVFLPFLLATGSVLSSGTAAAYKNRPLAKNKKRYLTVLIGLLVVWFIFKVIFPAANAVKSRLAPDFKTAFTELISQKPKQYNRRSQKKDTTHAIFGGRRAVIITSAAICVHLAQNNIRMEYEPVQILAAGFIPRVLWPNKPIISKGGWFNIFLMRLAGDYGESGTSMALTAAGELFWAYGLMVAALMILLTGWLFGFLLNRLYGKDLRNLFASAALIEVTIVFLKGFEESWSQFMSLIVLMTILAEVVQKLFLGRSARYALPSLTDEKAR